VQSGWEYPAWFGGKGTKPVEEPSYTRTQSFERVRSECEAVRDRVGLFETSAYAKFFGCRT
jgi:dimethylglycine dehydrogenase